MKPNKFVAVITATVFMGFLGKAQQVIIDNANFSSVTTTPSSISQFQVEQKLLTQNSVFNPSGTQVTGSFTSNARWNSMGNLNAGSQILNGFRTQTDGRALAWGHSVNSSGVLSNSFIQWGGNNAISPVVAPGDLEFRSFTNPGVPGFPSSDDLRFSIRGADGTSLFGRNASLKFISPIFGTPETPQLEINAFDNTTGLSKLGFGVYTQNNKAVSFITEGDPTNVIGDITAATIAASGGDNVNIGLQVSGSNGVAFLPNNNYGIISTANNASSGTGVIATATNNFWSTGVSAFGSGGNAYGIVAGASGGFQAAGFFNGDVYYTGSLISVSDAKLKKEIKKEPSIIERVMKLNPVNYTMNSDKIIGISFSKTLQHGFLAQEVEKIFPEIVTPVVFPNSDTNSNKKETESYKGVNYTMFVSILTKAIQEQQTQIEELKKQLAARSNEVVVINENSEAAAKLKASSFMLAQNVPNPFTSSTTIKYSIPANQNAMIAVLDLNGKMLLQFNNLKGASQVTINGNTLQAGMYLYSLVVNGQEIITKKMILTK
jgi:hypothetical protein